MNIELYEYLEESATLSRSSAYVLLSKQPNFLKTLIKKNKSEIIKKRLSKKSAYPNEDEVIELK